MSEGIYWFWGTTWGTVGNVSTSTRSYLSSGWKQSPLGPRATWQRYLFLAFSGGNSWQGCVFCNGARDALTGPPGRTTCLSVAGQLQIGQCPLHGHGRFQIQSQNTFAEVLLFSFGWFLCLMVLALIAFNGRCSLWDVFGREQWNSSFGKRENKLVLIQLHFFSVLWKELNKSYVN